MLEELLFLPQVPFELADDFLPVPIGPALVQVSPARRDVPSTAPAYADVIVLKHGRAHWCRFPCRCVQRLLTATSQMQAQRTKMHGYAAATRVPEGTDRETTLVSELNMALNSVLTHFMLPYPVHPAQDRPPFHSSFFLFRDTTQPSHFLVK